MPEPTDLNWYDDIHFGRSGDDWIRGLGGDDYLSDRYAGNDTLDGGDGYDTVFLGFAGASAGVVYAFAPEQTVATPLGSRTLLNFEAVALAGSAHADTLTGGAGNDHFESPVGDDVLDGGAGVDSMYANYAGAPGAIFLTLQDDATSTTPFGAFVTRSIDRGFLIGSAFSDTIAGGTLLDEIYGRAGDDSLSGESGDDVIHAEEGQDTLDGGDGHDHLDGGAGNDVLSGGAGDDGLFDAEGDNLLMGGQGDDVLSAGAGGDDTLDGGDGFDIALLDFSFGSAGVTVTPASGGLSVSGGLKVLQDIERVEILGSRGDDRLVGATLGDRIFGNDGNDTLEGGLGTDTVDGGAGVDVVRLDFRSFGGGAYSTAIAGGFDTSLGVKFIARVESLLILGGSGADTLAGSGGGDTIEGGGDADIIIGGAGNDSLSGGAGADLLEGGDGNDVFDGGGGDDSVNGGLGVDGVFLRINGSYFFSGSQPVTTALGRLHLSNIEFATIQGGSGADTLTGGGHGDMLIGAGSADLLIGLAGDDTIQGQDGDDRIEGGDGRDRLDGGTGNDTVADGSAGGGVLLGGPGVDQVQLGFFGVTAGVNVALGPTVIMTTSLGATRVEGFEIFEVDGSAFDDTISGTAAADFLDGLAGNDSLAGSGGDDLLRGFEGDDMLAGGEGNDEIVGGEGDDLLLGGEGRDLALYSGRLSDYRVEALPDGSVRVADLRAGHPHGVDTARDIEVFYFADGPHTLASVQANSAPDAGDDDTQVAEDARSDNLWSQILGDDVDLDGDGLAIVSVSGGLGSLQLDTTARTLFYTADAAEFDALGEGDTFLDTFTYEIRDELGLTSTATVRVSVAGQVNADDAIQLSGPGPHLGTDEDEFWRGTAGADTLDGAGGDDWLEGGDGGDRLLGGPGVNRLFGEAGDDLLGGDPSGQRTLFDGGDGIDTLVITSTGERTTVNLDVGTVSGGAYHGSTMRAVENLSAGTAPGAVTFIGDAAANQLTGGRYEDSLSGGGGTDTLAAGAGADTLSGGAAGDRLVGGLGSDVFHFRPGELAGDRIVDFVGNGAMAGDSLVFESFGPGAALTSLGGGRFEVSYLLDGQPQSEVFTLNTTAIHSSDYLFI